MSPVPTRPAPAQVQLTAVMEQKQAEGAVLPAIGIPRTISASSGARRRLMPRCRISRDAGRFRAARSRSSGHRSAAGHDQLGCQPPPRGTISAIEPKIDPNSRLVTVRAGRSRHRSIPAVHTGDGASAHRGGGSRCRRRSLEPSTATRSSWSVPRAKATVRPVPGRGVFVRAGCRSDRLDRDRLRAAGGDGS